MPPPAGGNQSSCRVPGSGKPADLCQHFTAHNQTNKERLTTSRIRDITRPGKEVAKREGGRKKREELLRLSRPVNASGSDGEVK